MIINEEKNFTKNKNTFRECDQAKSQVPLLYHGRQSKRIGDQFISIMEKYKGKSQRKTQSSLVFQKRTRFLFSIIKA